MVEEQWCDFTDGRKSGRPGRGGGGGGLIHDPVFFKRNAGTIIMKKKKKKKKKKVYLSISHKVRVNQDRYELTKIGTS